MMPEGIKVTQPVSVIMEGMRLDSVLRGDMRDTLIFSDGGKASVTMVVESAENWLRDHYGKHCDCQTKRFED